MILFAMTDGWSSVFSYEEGDKLRKNELEYFCLSFYSATQAVLLHLVCGCVRLCGNRQ